ncbi:O-antigen ligase family protein [Rhodobium gokarnense]|uniref:O-antigen ligase n=1 Tax=Rhodobium gokarnense TaxID=364296 RepID=A0ABT3HHS1_9HYPH|nr:O-antigen ligase family protein [Rhodobium gokarnense]MCW2309954.1 O-antigen ligase [Rhodobium gokarnense]
MTAYATADCRIANPAASQAWERTLAAILAVLLIIFATQSFQFLFADKVQEGMTTRDSAASNPVYLAIFAAQYGIALLLLLYSALSRGLGWQFLAGMIIPGVAALSALWSVGTKMTVTNTVVLTYLVIASYVLSVHFRPAEVLRIYFRVTAFCLFASLVLYVAAPDQVLQPRYGGGWVDGWEFRGVMASKNFAGFVFASTFLLAFNGKLIGIGAFWRYSVGLMALGALVLTSSATAVLIVVLLAPASVLLRLSGPYRALLAFAMVILFFFAIMALPVIGSGAAIDVLGRDATFTGRTDLWRLAFENIAERPVLGFGYTGFFDADPFSPAWQFWEHFRYFLTATFHNAAIEALVSLGLVGLALLAGLCLIAGAAIFNRTVDEGSRLVLVILLSVFLIGGTMEFTILHHNYIGTVVAFYAAFVALTRYGPAQETLPPSWQPVRQRPPRRPLFAAQATVRTSRPVLV